MMTLPTPVLPYGLRDVKLTPYTDQTCTALGTAVDLPVAQTLSFSETEDFNDLNGDDETVATHGSGPTVAWELDAGGISLEAWAVITGGTLTTIGSTAKVLKKNISQIRPYFKAEGQSISDSGGDIHCEIFRCKMNDDMEGEFGYGEFLITKCKGVGYGSLMSDGTRTPPLAIGDLYQFTQNSTVVNINTGPGAPTVLETSAITTTGMTAHWTAPASGADSYILQYAPSPYTTWTAIGGTITGVSQAITGLTTGTFYVWRVAAVLAGVQGPWATIDDPVSTS